MGDIRLAVNSNLEPDINADYGVRSENVKAEARDDGEEDIFGKRPNRPEAPVKMARTSSDALAPPSDGLEASIDFDGRDEAAAGMTKGQKESSGEGNKGKRARVPQQILDNKAVSVSPGICGICGRTRLAHDLRDPIGLWPPPRNPR